MVIRESFSVKLGGVGWGLLVAGTREQFVKIFCTKKIFSTNLRKFPPTKVSRYTVATLQSLLMWQQYYSHDSGSTATIHGTKASDRGSMPAILTMTGNSTSSANESHITAGTTA